uniref:ATP synthase complex subunit 8 n=1 Tax=Kaestneriella sp. KaspPE TaxID=2597008 RepID=A0A8K1ZFQ0_9NEOP|nr:ATP synthase F0 subunit 8 [Kaestneriella sp. KaspPE]
MPQMNPTWWLSLFFLFIIIFLLTNPLIYFTKNFKTISSLETKKNKKMNNWKW